jgi:hypothetical protein
MVHVRVNMSDNVSGFWSSLNMYVKVLHVSVYHCVCLNVQCFTVKPWNIVRHAWHNCFTVKMIVKHTDSHRQPSWIVNLSIKSDHVGTHAWIFVKKITLWTIFTFLFNTRLHVWKRLFVLLFQQSTQGAYKCSFGLPENTLPCPVYLIACQQHMHRQ